jgi:hypothetical protein
MDLNYLIEERVIERAMADYPNIEELVEFSTPVVSFGYPKGARVATLGINPSSNEFQIGNGNKSPLRDGEKRLIDTLQFGIEKPKSLSRDQAVAVIKGCYNYFNIKPYEWFKKLEQTILVPSGFSYHDSTACHLDLVQWATDPVWQSIKDKNVTKSLLEADKDFLEFQLKEYDFEVIFLNGGTVMKTVKSLDLCKFKEVGTVDFNSKGTQSVIELGEYDGKQLIGWGVNAGYDATYKPGLAQLSAWLENHFKITQKSTANAINKLSPGSGE